MRKLLLAALAIAPLYCGAQVLTFETLTLPGSDTFYVNAAHHLTDGGFNAGAVHFPYYYDTTYHSWSGGFVYSNKKDTVTSGYTNQYAAKPGQGAAGSDKYLVWYPGYGVSPNPYIPQNANDTVENTNWFRSTGMYVTNSTYAYNSMRDGDAIAKKFGGASGNDADWFKLHIQGYKHRGLQVTATGSVDFYLADFRFANNAQDYIIKDWTMVDLTPLGAIDSMAFSLSSSDTGMYGMNTPSYFCMDNLSITMPTAIHSVPAQSLAKVYPNPATTSLFVDIEGRNFIHASIYDVTGKLMATQPATSGRLTFNTATFAAGVYLLKLEGAEGVATVRFTKQ